MIWPWFPSDSESAARQWAQLREAQEKQRLAAEQHAHFAAERAEPLPDNAYHGLFRAPDDPGISSILKATDAARAKQYAGDYDYEDLTPEEMKGLGDPTSLRRGLGWFLLVLSVLFLAAGLLGLAMRGVAL